MSEEAAHRWQQQLDRDGVVVLRLRRGRSMLVLALCLLFSAVGVLMIVDDGPGVGSVLALLVFGVLGVPVSGWSAVTGRPHVRVTRDGVTVRSNRIYWADVSEIRTQEFRHRGSRTTTLVVLAYDDAAARVEARMGTTQRSLMVFQRSAFGDSLFGLPLNWSPSESERLADWLRTLQADAEPG